MDYKEKFKEIFKTDVDSMTPEQKEKYLNELRSRLDTDIKREANEVNELIRNNKDKQEELQSLLEKE